ncbi:MAG: helicase [Bacteroidetes bacterium]|nr:helicase [Bacteroidota bacterium]MBU1797429.1 helicase [Bacteroidota bacterium]
MAKVYHSEIYGLRERKYDWLNKHDIKNVKWNELEPNSEFYLFIPQDQRLQKKYQTYSKITEIFPLNNTGIVTKRDSFVIGFNKNEINQRIRIFSDKSLSDEFVSKSLKLPLRDKDKWDLHEARKHFYRNKDLEDYYTHIQYRPFDKKWIFYHPTLVARQVEKVMIHLLQDNLAICVGRTGSATGSDNYDIVFIAENIVDLNLFRRGGELVFPLYLYPETIKREKKKNPLVQMMMFEPEIKYQGKQPNIKPELFEDLKKNYKKDVTPEEIFYYIYAVLYSNTYRKKYAEFLKIDFPRVPFTKDYKLFIQIGKLGKQLADLHLLKSKELDKTISKFQIDGSNKVEKPKYEEGKVWINKEQYFDGIKEEVWQYQIGGYQVCEKWLKDRKERTLTLDEIKTYCKIVTSLSKTIELQKKIDRYFEEVEKTV